MKLALSVFSAACAVAVLTLVLLSRPFWFGGPKIDVDPAIVEAVETRQANMREMGTAYKNIDDALNADSKVDVMIISAVSQINSSAQQLLDWFPAGTGPDSGVDTAAKAEIWQRPDDFKVRRSLLAAEAQKLVQAVSAGDRAAFVAQFKAVGDACDSCHNTFRSDDD